MTNGDITSLSPHLFKIHLEKMNIFSRWEQIVFPWVWEGEWNGHRHWDTALLPPPPPHSFLPSSTTHRDESFHTESRLFFDLVVVVVVVVVVVGCCIFVVYFVLLFLIQSSLLHLLDSCMVTPLRPTTMVRKAEEVRWLT